MGFLLGCQKGDDPRIVELQHQLSNADSRILNLENQIAKLTTLTSNESDSISLLWTQGLEVRTNFNLLRSQFLQFQYANSSAPVTPQDKGYNLIKTPYGSLLLSTESVEPYLDGYKIHLQIGNPTSANFSGFSLICSSYQTTNIFDTMQTFTNTMTEKLSPGSWTPIDFILAPSDMDRVRNAAVSIELNQLNLLKRPPPSQ